MSKIRNYFTRKVGSKILTKWVNEDYSLSNRKEMEEKRIKENRHHEVYYFHQIKDPYSFLASQVLSELNDIYDINLNIVLVGEPTVLHEPEMFYQYCLEDAISVAKSYGCSDIPKKLPSNTSINLGEKVLLNTSKISPTELTTINNMVWNNRVDELMELSKNLGDVGNKIIQNNIKRQEMGHYQGGVFHYEGENYWGLDRLFYLEERLDHLGLKKLRKNISKGINLVERPAPFENINKLILEFYPSLNSPYTYISFERVKKIQNDYPVSVVTKPVLPMLMREMKIPSYKAKYILTDAAREARRLDIKIGPVLSPLGKPAERAYSLFPWINDQGKGLDYMHQLMKDSFANGIDIGKKSYLKKLVNLLDLNWAEAIKNLDSKGWKKCLEENRLNMYEGNSWGVPSFKLMNSDNSNIQTFWGQDRIWQIEKSISDRINNDPVEYPSDIFTGS